MLRRRRLAAIKFTQLELNWRRRRRIKKKKKEPPKRPHRARRPRTATASDGVAVRSYCSAFPPPFYISPVRAPGRDGHTARRARRPYRLLSVSVPLPSALLPGHPARLGPVRGGPGSEKLLQPAQGKLVAKFSFDEAEASQNEKFCEVFPARPRPAHGPASSDGPSVCATDAPAGSKGVPPAESVGAACASPLRP